MGELISLTSQKIRCGSPIEEAESFDLITFEPNQHFDLSDGAQAGLNTQTAWLVLGALGLGRCYTLAVLIIDVNQLFTVGHK